MEGMYTVSVNKDGTYNVVRMAPTVIAKGLKLGEAEALAFALSTQVRMIEGDLK